MEEYFRQLADTAPRWNFIWMYEDRQQGKILSGLWMTIKLSVMCLIFSVIIGVVGAWMQGAPSRVVRAIVQGYIQLFRNTPPMVQLLFFYFALGQFTPVVVGADGWTVEPIISNVGWAIVSLSMFAGAFNVEIFRAGIEAVPESTVEAAESLGFSRLQIYIYVLLPLAFRVSLPCQSSFITLLQSGTIIHPLNIRRCC